MAGDDRRVNAALGHLLCFGTPVFLDFRFKIAEFVDIGKNPQRQRIGLSVARAGLDAGSRRFRSPDRLQAGEFGCHRFQSIGHGAHTRIAIARILRGCDCRGVLRMFCGHRARHVEMREPHDRRDAERQ